MTRISAGFLGFLLLISTGSPTTVEAGTVLAGSGYAVVHQEPEPNLPDGLTAQVRMIGGIAGGVLEDESHTAVRLQFIRPDEEAVGFLVFGVELSSNYDGDFVAGQPGMTLQYYEQSPDDVKTKRFLMDEWEGAFLSGRPSNAGNVQVSFDVTVVDYGADELGGTQDDRIRRIQSSEVLFYAKGDLSNVDYHDNGQAVVASDTTIILVDDGCSGSNDYYDDGYYDDTGYYDSGYDGYGDSSCDGDTYDDGYDDSWSDSDYDDSSCDGDDWDDGGDWSDDEWLNDPVEPRLHNMSPWPSLMHLARKLRRPLRVAPLALSVLFLLWLRRRNPNTTRANNASVSG